MAANDSDALVKIGLKFPVREITAEYFFHGFLDEWKEGSVAVCPVETRDLSAVQESSTLLRGEPVSIQRRGQFNCPLGACWWELEFTRTLVWRRAAYPKSEFRLTLFSSCNSVVDVMLRLHGRGESLHALVLTCLLHPRWYLELALPLLVRKHTQLILGHSPNCVHERYRAQYLRYLQTLWQEGHALCSIKERALLDVIAAYVPYLDVTESNFT
jgi:hypothetical protein